MLHDSGRYEMNRIRPNRRISRPSRHNGFTCSQQSVFVAMDRFVTAVNNMQSTVLVPSRLLDVNLSESNVLSRRLLPPNPDSTDLYSFFTMFKEIQTELLWGPNIEAPDAALSRSSSYRSSPSSLGVMKHVRQSSDSHRRSDSDNDSVFTDPDSADEQQSLSPPRNSIASAFRYHLHGLHAILHELADTADIVSSRYQEEIEPSST